MPRPRYREFVRALCRGQEKAVLPTHARSQKGGQRGGLKPTEGHRHHREAKFLIFEFHTEFQHFKDRFGAQSGDLLPGLHLYIFFYNFLPEGCFCHRKLNW